MTAVATSTIRSLAPTLLARIYEVPGGGGRLKSMEGLRGVAVLMVFFVHVHALFGEYVRSTAFLWAPSRFLGSIGNAGVDLFFAVSGYLIYGALVRHRTTIAHFLHRRVQRIYPTFFCVFVLYLVLSMFFSHASKLHGKTGPELLVYVFQNALLLPGVFNIVPIITVSWSLSYELFFYLVTTAVVYATRMWAWPGAWRITTFVTLWAAYTASSFMMSHSHIRALMFVVGILVYEAAAIQKFRQFLNARGEAVAIMLFCLTLVYAYLLDTRSDIFSSLPGWWAGRSTVPGIPTYQGPYKTLALSVSTFWFIAYSFLYEGRLGKVLSWTPLRYLGNMSYSYYLIHGVTLQGIAILITLMSPSAAGISVYVAAVGCGFAATWISATILFLCVEKPSSFVKRPFASGANCPARRAAHA